MNKGRVEHEERAAGDAVDDHKNVYSEEQHGLEVPNITWYKHKGLRHLYLLMPVLFLGATVNGYDSSLLNGLQTLTPWQNCEILG
jgi:hypothetical protein